jgi:hypothetical protein
MRIAERVPTTSIASAIEHEAVLVTLKALARRGWRTTLLPVDASGIIRPEALEAALADDTAIVSVMHANNEIGTIQPIAELARLARARGALFHVDAVQSVGKMAVDARTLGVDLLALSAHKFNGPKGAGALWIRRGVRVVPVLTGGKHERTRRAGTENVAAIAGLGVVARMAPAKIAAAMPGTNSGATPTSVARLRRRKGKYEANQARSTPTTVASKMDPTARPIVLRMICCIPRMARASCQSVGRGLWRLCRMSAIRGEATSVTTEIIRIHGANCLAIVREPWNIPGIPVRVPVSAGLSGRQSVTESRTPTCSGSPWLSW